MLKKNLILIGGVLGAIIIYNRTNYKFDPLKGSELNFNKAGLFTDPFNK